MKKGNTLYLWFIVVLFILLWIPYFQNISGDGAAIMFFNGAFTFVQIYPWLLFLGVLEGALIVLYMESLIEDMKKQEIQKFDL